MTWLPLFAHLADCAGIAERIWENWLSDGVKKAISRGLADFSDAKKLFVFLSAAHDIGKATPVFQYQEKPSDFLDLNERLTDGIQTAGLPYKPWSFFTRNSETPHALATLIILEDAGFHTSITAILGAHHGKPAPLNCIGKSVEAYPGNFYIDKNGKEVWRAVQREYISYALELADYTSPDEIPAPNKPAQVLLSALVIMVDWIASNEEFFPLIQLDDSIIFDFKARTAYAWKRLDLPRPWTARDTYAVSNLYGSRFSFDAPNEVQIAVERAVADISEPGILVLEAPMGCGKTEAALVAAEIFADKSKRKGIFFALPTQANSNGIFPRIEKWIKALESEDSHSLRLVHGRASFNKDYSSLPKSSGIGVDDNDGVFVHQWFEGRKKSILDDFVVGTIDQILMSALQQKHVMLRHLGLANKVVIIDECHAYDAYMSQYLERSLRWLGEYKVPVIVLSATLPAAKRRDVIDAYTGRKSAFVKVGVDSQNWASSREYPLITCTDGGVVRQCAVAYSDTKREVGLRLIADTDAADILVDMLSGGGCAGVIVNTVKYAQEIAKQLSIRFGEDVVRLFHSGFIAKDRADKEDTLLAELGNLGKDKKRPDLRIVVGTQVLEQSLDIDFDVIITEICPMDLLLQRIGRLHRHSRSRPKKLKNPICFITGTQEQNFNSGSEAVYGRYSLMRSKALLPSYITLPDDIPQLVQDAYDDSLNPLPDCPEYIAAQKKHYDSIKIRKQRADTFRLDPPYSEQGYYLNGWLDLCVNDASEKNGEAAVRDGDESIEVLLVQESDGEMMFLPWIENGRVIDRNKAPDDKTAMSLVGCGVRLPHALCTKITIEKTIKELESYNMEKLNPWQGSSWLKGELFLILDDAYMANLNQYILKYDIKYGLSIEKEVLTGV